MSLTKIATSTERVSHGGTKIQKLTTVDGATITRMALKLAPSGAIKHVVSFNCQDCGKKYEGDATESKTGIHGLTCPACGFVHADH